ncbi:MAG: ABC transporter permease [Asgard group archaeon]|nr:ABC transporter permease [Asgard group archaeon]
MLYAIRHALRGLSRRKLKNIINLIGILIGVSLLAGVQIATDSLVNGMKDTVNQRFGNADIDIQKGEFLTEFFNYSIYEQLRDDPLLAPYIDGISPRISSEVFVTSFTTTKQIEIFVTWIGINETLDQSFGTLTPDETYGNNEFNFSTLSSIQCIVGKRLAESVIAFEENDEGRIPELMLPNRIMPIEFGYLDAYYNNRSLTGINIKGVANTEGKGVLNSGFTVFMKLQYLQEYFNTTSTGINNIIVSTTEGNDNAVFVQKLIEERLMFYLGEEEGSKFRVFPQKFEAYDDIESSVKTFRIVLYVFGSLIILSGVMLILNITLMNIDERQRSIGIMRAIGMTKRQLLIVLLTESMVLGGIGSLLGLGGGVASGLGIIFLLENFLDVGEILQNIPLIVKPVGMLVSFLIGLIISLLAALYPAWKASRIDIVQTINEVETPQVRRRSGDWSAYLGIGFFLSAISALIASLLITPEWRWMIFIGSIFLGLLGLGFIFSRLVGAKISFNLLAISWMIAGLLGVLVLNPYLNNLGIDDENALYAFLISMLGLVFGTIIFVALNLEWVSNRFNAVFQKIQSMRSMGIISMRYVGKKKTRSALTFAIFGVILTMNVFLAVFTGSFTSGFDDFALREQGGVDIIAFSPSGNSFNGDAIEVIKEADPNIEKVVGMKFIFTIQKAYANIMFNALNQTLESLVEVEIPTDMWGINDEFLNLTDYTFNEIWEGIEGNPWLEAKNSTNKYVILPFLLREFEFDRAGVVYNLNTTVGDIITIPEIDPDTKELVLGNYTVIAFVETTSYSMSFSNFLFTSEGSPIFSSVTGDTAFLVSVNPKLSLEEVIQVSHNIEFRFMELATPENFVLFDTLVLKDRLENFMDLVIQSVSFMQAFVSLGLIVGVLGLIVVSLRGITERTREIGMMRALGFKRSEVITAVVVEIFAVALVGLVIGFVNGFILGYGMYTQYLIQYDFIFIVPWAILALFIAVTIALSIISAVIPARRASKIPPSEALRYTG